MASLIAPEYFNNHIAVEGEIIVKTVPNDTGSVLVWNPTTKKISQRTKADIIADLDIMTLSTSQFVYGRKYFRSSGTSKDEHVHNLWVRSEDGTDPGLTFWKTGYASSTLTLRDDGYHFGIASSNHYDPVKAEGFRKNGSSDNYFLTGGGNDYDSRKKEDSYIHSSRNFLNGTLVETDVDYSVTSGDQFLLEMKGNMYSSGNYLPLDFKLQGYIYNDTIISGGGYSTLYYFNYIIALNSNGKLAFWFPRLGYWQGFDAKLTVGYGGLNQGNNRVTSITDSPDPGGNKRVQINLEHLLSKEGLISDNIFWEKKDIGSYWALDSDKPIAGLSGNSAQIILSGGLLASSSYTDSQFIPADGLHSKGFIQSDEGFFNRYWKADVRNPIWSFGNAQTYGFSYYQGSANTLNEGIGFHFGDVDNPTHFFGRSGQIYSKQGVYSTSFATGNNQVLNYANPSTLYIGNPTINNIIESNNSNIAHYRNGVSGVVWDSHNLDPSTFVQASNLNNYIPYNGATQNVNLGTKDLEFNDGGAISKRQNDVRVFNKVYQGYYDFGGHTGILALKMPQVSSEQTMFSIDINIYGYENKYLGKVNVAFYKYTSGTLVTDGSKAIWEVTDNFPTTTARVGIGTDGYVSILLGEADTFWNGYLSFEVARVETKYGYYNLNWDTGWSHALETNFDLYNSNIIVLPSDVVATRSWLTNFANNNYIPRTVQPNDNFNSLGGNSTSGVYKADNDGGGVKYLKSTMLHLGAQEATSQLQIKHNDGSAAAGELAYRGGYLGNWTNWRVAWDNVNFKPAEYQTRNTDEIISAAKSYYNRIPFKFKNGAYKSWAIQKPTNNGLVFVPSVTKNAEDWDFNNSVQFTDDGQVSSKGFNKTGSNDSYVLTGGGGHRLASDFVSSSALQNYVDLDTEQSIGAKKYFSQGLTVNTDYGGLPVIGQKDNIPSKVSSIDETYGMGMGVLSSGKGYIQQQRFDGTPHAYDLLLQPSGGNVVIGHNQMDYHSEKLQTVGRIVSTGNEMNSVKTYVSVQNVDEIVAGHTLNWYNTSWKVGNMRGGSDDSRGYNFEFSTDGGATYREKVRIHTDSNITTQNYGNAQQWNLAYQNTLSDVQTYSDANGDYTIYHRNDGSSFDIVRRGINVIDTRIKYNGLDSNGSDTFVPNTHNKELNSKLLPLFHHVPGRDWQSSLILKGWKDAYKAWRITGPATQSNTEQDFYLSQSKSEDGTWMEERMVWTDRHFTQNNINQWNNAISLNNQFTNYTNNGLAVVDAYNGVASGIYNVNEGVSLVGLESEYYKYSSTYGKWEGINFHRGSHNIGIGTEANDADKINVSGSVKAEGNFKSIDEDPNTLFIPNGELASLKDEIINEKRRIRLSHEMIEQDSNPNNWEYESENRMLVIRCRYGIPFHLKKCYRGQRILVMNANDSMEQEFIIRQAGFKYNIPPYNSIQLFVWDDKTVYKYAENKMWV